MLLKDRKYRLVIGDTRTGSGREITELNIKFRVDSTTDTKKKTNKAVISVFNLDEQTLKLLDEEEYLRVTLDCGYEGLGLENILVGDVLEVKTEKKGTDRVTTITMAEGYSSLNFEQLSATVPKGRTVEDAIEEVRKGMFVIAKGNYFGRNKNKPLKEGYPLVGSPKQMLDEIARTYRIQYRIRKGRLDISDEGGAYANNKARAFKFNESSGLVGIPFKHLDSEGKRKADPTSRKGVSFKALLNPFIEAGDIVFIESELITGFFKVKDLTYIGDYRGTSWHIECFCQDLEVEDTQ